MVDDGHTADGSTLYSVMRHGLARWTGSPLVWLALAGMLVLAFGPAFGAEGGAPGAEHKGGSEVLFIVQIALLLITGRLLGEAMTRIGQPAIMGQLIAGVLLGPTVFGSLWPEAQKAVFSSKPEQKAMIDAISQFGILMLLLLTGMETDLKLVRKVGRAAIGVSMFGVAVPFVCGFTAGQFLPESMLGGADQRTITSLFLGTALSISSVKIVAMIVREMDFMRRNLGQIIVASAIMEDSVGWVIVAITLGLAQTGTVDAWNVGKALIGTAAFMAFSLTIGRRIVFTIIRWTNDTFTSEVPVITAILVIMCLMALITDAIGVHTVLGAFVAGILVGESPILTKHIDDELRGMITAFFMPVFFGTAGLSADLTILRDPRLLGLTVILILIASVGKFAGAFAGGKIGGLSYRESYALATGMNARGSTEVVIATIGLSMGALTHDLYTMIVTMAVVTTLIMPPTLRAALRGLPISRSEKQRLEREEFEEKGFVTNLERLLLAVDHSANGKFAARVAGMLAGSRGMPITIVPIGAEKPAKSKKKAAEDDEEVPAAGAVRKPEKQEAEHEVGMAEAAVLAAAEKSRPMNPDDEKQEVAQVAVLRKADDKSPDAVIIEESQKGYDMLFVGLEHTLSRSGFHGDVAKIVEGFEGPIGLMLARGVHEDAPDKGKLKILVPVTGTDVSRRAAEVAIALARASNNAITGLYVSSRQQNKQKQPRQRAGKRKQEEAILKEIANIADQYKCKMDTAIRTDIAPDEAILREADKGEFNLIVLGVNRRPGERLFFGETAAAIIDDAKQTILLVSS